MALLARDIQPGDYCDIYTVLVVTPLDHGRVSVTARDHADGHNVYWAWEGDDVTPLKRQAVSEITHLSSATLLASQARFEKLMAGSQGVQREQIQTALNLINAELDSREDRGLHDDDSEY
jgi:hypothetical protein